MKKYLIYFSILLLFSCGNDQLEVTDNDEFEYVEFNLPDFSKEIEGDYEFCVVFPESKDLTITAKPKEIWNKNKNIFVLNLNAANNNKISKAQFHLNINKGAEIGEYSINAPKIIVKYNGETIDEYTAPAKFKKQVIYSVPMDPLLFWGIIIGVLLLLAAITYLVLRKMEIIGPKTFKMGRLSFLSDGASVPSVELSKLENLSLQEYYPEVDGVMLVPIDRLNSKKRKMRMANMKISNSDLTIKISNGIHNETLFGNTILYHMDRIEIEIDNNENIIIEYTNSKNPRI